MKKLKKFFRKIPSRYLILAMIVAVAVSCITVSGTFASFQTTVIGTGETPVAAWGFEVKINNDFADDTSRISYISLAGDEKTTPITDGGEVLGALHTNNRDDSTILPDYILAPGTAGYMPIEIDGSDANLSVLVTVKAEFSYTTAFTYYDNLGRRLTLHTDDSSSGTVPVYPERNVEGNSVFAIYVGYITYNYYVSYQQIQKWADGDFIDIGFRWNWAENDYTATEDMPQYIYTRITVTGAQVTNANQVKDSDTVINFVSESDDFEYGNVLNVVNSETRTSLTAAPGEGDGDLYVDVNPASKPEDLNQTSVVDLYMGKTAAIAVEPTVAYTGNIVLGTTRSQHGYPTFADNKASVSFNENVNSTSIQISDDFTYSTLESVLNLYVNEAPTMYDALNNVKTTLTTSSDNTVKANANLVKSIYNGGTAITDVASVAKLVSDNSLLWDSQGKVFVAESGVTPSVRYFKAYNGVSAGTVYSIYATGTLSGTIPDLSVGLDVGENIGVTEIDYVGTDVAQSVIIRSNSGIIKVNAPLDTVTHYGTATLINIVAVANSSYHEFGDITLIQVAKGRIALEEGSDVDQIHLNSTKIDDKDVFDEIIIAVDNIDDLPTFSRDQADILTEGTLVATVVDTNDTEKIYLFQQGIYEQIKVEKVDENTNDKVWVDTSAATSNVKTVANQIANNYTGSKTNGIIDDIVTTTAEDKQITVKFDYTDRTFKVDTDAAKTTETDETKLEEAVVAAEDKATETGLSETEKQATETGATKFAGGAGTESNPYQIETSAQFANIVNGTYSSKKYYKLLNSMDVSDFEITSSNTYGFDSAIARARYVYIDGNGKSITSTNSELESIFGDFVGSTLYNVTINTSSPVTAYSSSSTFEKVTVKGNKTLYFSNNTGIMTYYCGSLNFIDVDIDVDVVGSSYDGVFMGYTFGGTYNLTNCSYSGEYVSEKAGLVFGNPTYSAATINITNFVNNGIIRHTNTTDVGANYCLYGIDNDGQHGSKTVNFDGVDYSGTKAMNIVLAGTGSYIVGPKDANLAITLNADNTFTIAKSADENVAYYKVEIVANVPYSSGSTNISVIETINADGSDTYTTKLKKFGFKNGTTATYKLDETWDIITVEGVDYYMDANTDHNCNVRGDNPQIFVRSYDNDNKLISVVVFGE